MITIKSAREIETMAAAGRIVAGTLALVAGHVHPGVSTAELDRLAEEFIRSHPGARPSFKGLYDFPATLCTSINQEVVHGIPSRQRILRAGDVLSVDVGVWLEGLHADSAATFPVGDVGDEARRLLRVTQEALAAGIPQARAGQHVGDIAHPVPQAGDLPHQSIRPARSNVPRPLGGAAHTATFTRTFSRAPSTAARDRSSATLASDRAFLLPMAPISRASDTRGAALRAVASGVRAALRSASSTAAARSGWCFGTR